MKNLLFMALGKNNYKVFFFKIFPKYKNLINKIIYFFLEKIKLNIFLIKLNDKLIKKVEKNITQYFVSLEKYNNFTDNFKKLKQNNPDIKIIIYHNDNPYSGIINYFKNRHYLNLSNIQILLYIDQMILKQLKNINQKSIIKTKLYFISAQTNKNKKIMM